MISTSTLAILTGIIARWLDCVRRLFFALLLLLSGRYIDWILRYSLSGSC